MGRQKRNDNKTENQKKKRQTEEKTEKLQKQRGKIKV